MARPAAIALLCLLAAPAPASVEYAARLEQARWILNTAPDACELAHDIPRYGVARFHVRSGDSLAFRVETILSGPSGRSARLALVPPGWRHDLRPRPLAEVISQAGSVRLDRPTTLEVYHALKAGYQLSVEHTSPGQGGFHVAAAVSPVRFREMTAAFERCRDEMVELDFRPVSEWRVHFGTGRSRLDHEAHRTLHRVIAAWRERRDLRVVVGGHADGRGGDRINEPLSLRRAQSVRTFLEVYGIPRERIEVRAFGSSWPLDPGSDESAWANNRRATVWLAR